MIHPGEEEIYFAAHESLSPQFAHAVKQRFENHMDGMKVSQRHTRMIRSWLRYYSRSEDGNWDTTDINEGGEQGELSMISPGRYRNSIQHSLTMATSAAPSYEPVATNTDAEAQADTMLVTGLLEHYNHDHRVKDKRFQRGEYAYVCGESILLAPWDPTIGETVGVEDVNDPETGEPQVDDDGQPVRKETKGGDFRFHVLHPWNFAYDPLCPDKDNPTWIICRIPKNKWDLALQFPQHREKILQQPRYSSILSEWSIVESEYENDDYIPVLCIYHGASPSVKGGRDAMLLIDGETVLTDSGLIYDRVPTFRCAPSDMMEGPGGYTPAFDLLPVMKARDAHWTTIFSNQQTFGSQLISIVKGSGVKVKQLAKNLRAILHQNGMEPKALNLLNTPKELFTFADMLSREGDDISGINEAVRGNTDAMKGDSGAKTAMVFASATQFNQGFQRALSSGDEALATHMVNTLRKVVTTPRVIAIAGRHNKFAARKFRGKDLEGVPQVRVLQASPIRDTLAGRMQLLDYFMAHKAPLSPDQIWAILSTGKFEPVYEDSETERLLIKRENEIIADPEDPRIPITVMTDDHLKHIQKHRTAMDDPDVREDPEATRKYQQHQQGHMDLLRGLSRDAPDVLLMLGMQPLPQGLPPGASPPGGPPGSPGGGPGKPPALGPPSVRMPTPPTNPTTGQPADIEVPEPPPVAMGGAA